ncbi:MAG: flagellar assembly protein FliW [Leptospiraceae bacterium]|nr:flagellar assembly protein FliW [Leptospiraceae bacterium]MDW8307345.1 flagellar assembly protein FliW [Leptospiraceae bacterium]
MKIETRCLGSVEISEDQIIHFPQGIFAFEHLHHYVLLEAKAPFYWLQSTEDYRLAFLVAQPRQLLANYQPKIDESELSLIGLSRLDDAEIWGIITIPPQTPAAMTINLQGPIIINPQLKLAGQFISTDETHSVRTKILEFLEKSSC